MIVVGLTGSIGMGKSVLAKQLRKLGIPVHEADSAVHKLLGHNGAAVEPVAKRFPQAKSGTKIDRKKLGQIIFSDAAARKDLEKILHPLVRRDSSKFLNLHRKRRSKIAVLDIPLLFETRQTQRFDHIICVIAPQFVQKRRVLSRPNMTESRLQAVRALQIPDAVKCSKADTVINTARGYRHSLSKVRKLVKKLRQEAQKKDEYKGSKKPKSLGTHARNP
ncbi:MAG: dephospho-CoA kinase [Proteobacteria bacterium]|nr:dephospho-CoA kinase [Pseudomonadota bacterium]